MASLQDTYAPNNRCFGCGPANNKGLHIKSRVEGRGRGGLDSRAAPLAFDGILNGGIAGALPDCHSNWAAAHHLIRKIRVEFHVKLMRPTLIEETCRADRQ